MTRDGGEKTRKAPLAGQWYPGSAKGVLDEIEGWKPYFEEEWAQKPAFDFTLARDAVLAVVPHAGWYFSGRLAAKTLKAARDLFGAAGPERAVVLGGHLPERAPVIAYGEDYWETPLDPVTLAPDLNGKLEKTAAKGLSLRTWAGGTDDNTIEVELPLVKHFFPDAKVLALRAVPDESSGILAETLAALFRDEKTLFVASSDLTHYGRNYGFAPAGGGEKGEAFRRKNDLDFMDAALALDTGEILRLGNRGRAACSAGAVGVVAALAKALNAKGFLVDHYSSSDVHPSDNSVGYAGMVFAVP
ncbi:MAG: AmmeMemoRadiSam system protein B [Deltaproteobacteria bacterium]|nr:AmmeMemoRadiSam system protein B [Deltaproteobacteria bacterium]